MATGSPTYHDFLPTPPTPDQSRSSLLPSSDQVHYGFVYCKKIRASTATQSALFFPTIFRLFAPAWRAALLFPSYGEGGRRGSGSRACGRSTGGACGRSTGGSSSCRSASGRSPARAGTGGSGSRRGWFRFSDVRDHGAREGVER
ncbi:hypothetical protein Naga_101249g2 [Nannochloropsis gaditana]|uniref:Uncharacterized protein n=1 Tax=Nannochloropsis gaditana TaxID=72520 RepID=W7TKZ1_9STRA|nr:hypothetical protein Naga_101249g2 [Nannochloropsis gaditana]